MTDKPVLKEKKKGSGTKIFVIILIIFLIGLNAFQAWWKYDTDLKNQATIEQKDNFITEQQTKLDSMIIVIDQQIEEATALGIEIEGLENLKTELEAELKKTKSWAYSLNRKKKQLAAKVAGFEELLKTKDQELAEAKKLNEELNTENTALKETIAERNDTINDLKQVKTDLEHTVAEARILRASDFKVIGMNAKGKEKDAAIYKAKWLDMIKVDFTIDPNKVALLDSKEVFLVVKNTSGTTIYDENSGGGTFDFEGNEMFYSVKQDIQYERDGKRVSFTFKNPNVYESGTQKVEVYSEGVLIGSTSFNVK